MRLPYPYITYVRNAAELATYNNYLSQQGKPYFNRSLSFPTFVGEYAPGILVSQPIGFQTTAYIQKQHFKGYTVLPLKALLYPEKHPEHYL